MANRALLVGINKYPGAALQGCVNDIRDMTRFLLERCGFKHREIRLLADARATTDEIKDRLTNWLLKGAQAGDRLLFHYSGHGSEMAVRDGSGDVAPTEDCICPVDFDFTPEHAITASDFEKIFAALPAGVEFNWVSDSCYSGDLAKAIPGSYLLFKSFPRPADIEHRLATARFMALPHKTMGRAAEHLNGALVSGCATDQTSADAYIDNRYNGAATYALIKQLRAEGGLTKPLTDVVAGMNTWLDANQYEQDPKLKGDPAITAKGWLTV